MSSYVFPGYPAFLDRAAGELGRPESARLAGSVAALSSLANLCAQATHADPALSGEILDKAAGFRDQIATALRASELMLDEVRAACAAVPDPVKPASVPADPPRVTRPGLAKNAKGSS